MQPRATLLLLLLLKRSSLTHSRLSRAFDLRRDGRLVSFLDVERYFVFECYVIFPFISASIAINPPVGFSPDFHIRSSVVRKLGRGFVILALLHFNS